MSVWVLLLLYSANCFAQPSQELLARKRVLQLMGTRFEITAVASDATFADEGIEAGINEVQRIEKLISSWDENSQTSEINKNAGIHPVKVDKELYDLIARSLRVSKLTNGAFDISFASAGHLWKFDGSMKEPPLAATSMVLGFVIHLCMLLGHLKHHLQRSQKINLPNSNPLSYDTVIMTEVTG